MIRYIDKKAGKIRFAQLTGLAERNCSMKTYKIAVIAGDGVGPEVMAEAVKVLKETARIDGRFDFTFTDYPWGCEYYLKTGRMMPEDGMEILKDYDAILLGAVGYPGVPDHISLRGLLLEIRHGFDQYINLRPVKLLAGAPCPLKDVKREDINMTFIRENSEGEYSGSGAWLYKDQQGKTLTSISKANALNYSMVFWDQIFTELGREYPDVETHSYLVDAASMFMVKDPGRFQIVVTSNLFGDILTDLGAAIAGGMGLAAGANLNPDKKFPSMFEPIHGSAPDIAGKGIANPLASIWTAAQMLDFFGYEDWGTRIVDAIERLLSEGKDLTPDLGGTASTSDCGDALVRLLEE